MTSPVTEDDEGKPVVDVEGDRIGTVTDVDFSVLQVEAEEGVAGDAEALRRVEREDDHVVYELQKDDVAEVTDGAIRVGTGN